ncbi:MAG: VCBS repeat-containing protein [Bacteroidales bacterium]|nr:VCBS repeat-containing protein [Bacteroidales bacterium]
MVYTRLNFLFKAELPNAYLLIVIPLLALSCSGKQPLFTEIKSSRSNITFNNRIDENDSINQLDVENLYNGGGVGIGDFNRDGLPDVYFTGNIVSCKLYLNQGDFVFRDVTDPAGVTGEGRWCRGVAVVDINNDGWPDIYVSATLKNNPNARKNMLYINQGLNTSGVPVFDELAAEYGLDDDSHTTQAAFFDYDNDGDLDVYLAVNEINNRRISPYLFRPVLHDGKNPSTGRFYRNDWNDSLKHSVFTDVSRQAGIQTEGYSHGVSIADFNEDGWKDLFVSNDFLTNDLLWINNRDGTFTDQVRAYFKHTSSNSMGNDAGDINNDGLIDLVTLDMNPGDNYRRKMMLMPNSYQTYQNTEHYGYSYQYVRNTLQLNQGPRPQDDSIGLPVFSEIGFYAGISATDWSWTPMLADFDNDGYRDLFITNGFPRDITDHDFAIFRNEAYLVATKNQILSQIPEVKLHNYVFRNNGNLSFSDKSFAWGITTPTFSNGAVYADLDQDGDLDVITNNIKDEASVYRNNAREMNPENSHFLQVRLKGDDRNIAGLGASVEIYYDRGKKQVWENSPFRGYISTIEAMAHFGLGQVKKVDSVLVKWQNGRMEVKQNIEADQTVWFNHFEATRSYAHERSKLASHALFREVTGASLVNYTHRETDFVDFNIQKLLPHKFSEYGPALAAGDMDGNGLDDFICGGSAGESAQLFLQQPDGKFIQRSLLTRAETNVKSWDDAGILLFDADSDGNLDLYISSGGYEHESHSTAYQDHFYLNRGKAEFSEIPEAIPTNPASKFCVRASDYDRDGDLDLFVAGRVDPWNYPKPVSSFIFRNDSERGKVKFTDVTSEVARDLLNVGLVCDALFTDFNNDGWVDLVLAGEWMPITFLQNVNGSFKNTTDRTGIGNQTGWWNSIAAGDFDNDNDIDYVVGNLGQNSFYKASHKYPVGIYAGDFDNNGSYDAFPSQYLPASQKDTGWREFPVHTRDDAVKQMISMRSKFQNYKSYAESTIDCLFSPEQLKGALVLKANNFQSCLVINDGRNRFSLVPLPVQAQLSVLNGMIVDDLDADGNLDLLINANDWGTEVSVGRYDALNGLLLRGDGQGQFTPLSIAESGIYIPGNGKGMAKLRGAGGRYLVAAGQNRGPLKIFELSNGLNCFSLQSDDAWAEVRYANGLAHRQEFHYGSSFLSQQARFIGAGNTVRSITLYNNSGQKREIFP